MLWKGSLKTAYKVIGELRHGEAEPGESYFHTCDNPRTCCNPSHIVLMDCKNRKRKLTSVWKKENKDKTTVHSRAQYYKNPDKYRQYSKEWKKITRIWLMQKQENTTRIESHMIRFTGLDAGFRCL